MKEYYLDNEDLLKIAVFNGIGGHYGYKNRTLQEQTDDLNKRFFNHFLEISPKKKYIVDSFFKKYSESYNDRDFRPIAFFKDQLEGKIEINEFIEPIFTANYVYLDDTDRVKFFKKIFEKHPPFLKITHDYISNQIKENKLFFNTNNLFDAYFQLLKNKNGELIRKNLNEKEILANIDHFNADRPAFLKKKINAYLSNFKRDEILYKHIIDSVGQHIEKNGTVKIFWEEKLNLFDKSIINLYKNSDKAEMPWGKTEDLFLYNFHVNIEYVVTKSHLTQNQSSYLVGSFVRALTNFLETNYNCSNMGGYHNTKVCVVFEKEDDKNRAKAFCEQIKNNLEEIINGYFKKDKTHSTLDEQMKEYFTKLNFAFDLDKQLINKEDSSTSKISKRKI